MLPSHITQRRPHPGSVPISPSPPHPHSTHRHPQSGSAPLSPTSSLLSPGQGGRSAANMNQLFPHAHTTAPTPPNQTTKYKNFSPPPTASTDKRSSTQPAPCAPAATPPHLQMKTQGETDCTQSELLGPTSGPGHSRQSANTQRAPQPPHAERLNSESPPNEPMASATNLLIPNPQSSFPHTTYSLNTARCPKPLSLTNPWPVLFPLRTDPPHPARLPRHDRCSQTPHPKRVTNNTLQRLKKTTCHQNACFSRSVHYILSTAGQDARINQSVPEPAQPNALSSRIKTERKT